MKYLKKISSLSFLVIAVLFCCSFFGSLKIKTVNADNNDNIILSVNQISKTIGGTNISGNTTAESLYNNLSLIESELNANTVVENNEVVLLDSTTDCVLVSLLPKNDTGYTLSSLTVYLKINGIYVQVQTYSLSNTLNNSVYIQAFDFSSLYSNTGIEIENMVGLYEFEFSYQYSFYENGVYKGERGSKSISFYLLNKTEYLTTNKISYENLTTKFDANKDKEQKNIYFYNYQTQENPTITFNPYYYNLNMTYTYKEDEVKLTGTHELDENGNITAYTLVSGNENVIHSIEAKETGGKWQITLNKLGLYDISYELVFKNDNALTILSGNSISDVVANNYVSLSGSNIYIFGYEAYYKDYANATNVQDAKYEQFYNNKFKTDFSSKLTETTDLESASGLFGLAENYAKTNQAQVKLNDYASLVNGYYYYNDTKYDYTNSTRFTENGKYVVVLQYNFSKYDELNGSSKKFTQLIVFEIQNTTPALGLKIRDEETNEFDTDLGINGTTNKDVQVSWTSDEGNPFMLQPKLTFRKNESLLNNIEITTNENLNSVVFEEDGVYTIELRYGLGYNTVVERTFTIDKTEIKYNLLYNFNNDNKTYSSKSNTEIETINSAFAFQVSKKGVESNTISATYSYIPLVKEELSAQNALINIDGKYYIQNGYKLSDTLFENIDYLYCEPSNKVGETNKISANGLYEFTFKDKAGNQKIVYIFLDNTESVVLQISETLSDLDLKQEQKNKLSYKSSETNLISENYSLILGTGKTIELNTSTNTEDLVEVFKAKDVELTKTLTSNSTSTYYKIFNHTNIAYTSEKLIKDNETIDESLNNGILSIKKPAGEVDRMYTLTLKDYFNKESSYKFELNTDKNLIMIAAKNKNESSLPRILPSAITNKEEVYIRYSNDSADENYTITSLTLNFYNYNNEYTGFSDESSKTFELLNLSKVNTETIDGISGGYITNSYINAIYENTINVTQPGKYVLTKIYKNGNSINYEFYVDRFKPIEKINDTTTIGSHLIFKLGGKDLTAETILNSISNNQPIKTNFKLTSLPENENSYKYSNVKLDSFKLSYTISILNNQGTGYDEPFEGNSETYDCNSVFKKNGTYKIKISDTTGNYIEFSIVYTNELVEGNFVTKDNNVISTNNACTASNELYYVFETAENEFMYNINLYKIKLYADSTLILETNNEKTTDFKGTFSLDKDLNVYYYSPYYSTNNKMFNLTRESISGNRYKYTLTILNGNLLDSNPLYENGQSKEFAYRIELKYEDSSITSEKIINIDHTSPTENAEALINNDLFLTSEEKTELLTSIKNKDNSYDVNFENYVLTVDGNFTFKTNSTNIKETSLIYYRKYNKFATNKTIDNYQSLVPGDKNYEGTITNRYRFNANLQKDNGSVYSNIASTKLNSPLKEIFAVDYGCYEIIEIDSAENYTIYSIQYVQNNAININFQAKTIGSGQANESNNYVEVNDVNFELTKLNLLEEDNNLADFVNVTIIYEGITQTLRLSATGINNQYASESDLREKINSILSENNNSNYGTSYKLTFQGRFGDPIVITYNVPQNELELTWQEYDNRFVVTIPQAQGATCIKEFNVYPATKDDYNTITVSTTSLDNDSNGQIIIKNSTTTDVGGRSYTFTNTVNIEKKSTKVYVYKIVWKDNFDRENSAYKVIGIKDVHELIYNGPTSTINDKIYTYKDTILRYQMQSYNLKISLKNLDTQVNKDLDISKITGDANSIAEVNLLEYLKEKDEKDKDWTNNQVEFNITLTSILEENGVSKTYNFSFIYYPLIPEIIFTDSSNSELQPAKSSDSNYETYLLTTSKNVTISFENSIFPVTVNCSIEIVSNNSTTTENYNNIASETTLTRIGTYEVTITNSLNHSVTYRFAIKEASLYPYAVIVSQLGVQSYELTPSETQLELMINGNSKSVDTYYSIYDTIIEVNADNNLYYQEIEVQNIESNIKVYLIEPKNNTSESNKIYIAVVKVAYSDNFLNLGDNDKQILQLYTSSSTTSESIDKYSYVATEKSGAKLTLSKNFNTYEGNTIQTKIYYNNKLVSLNFAKRDDLYLLNLTEAGTYDIYFEDFAGNNQLFKGNDFLRVIVLNKVIVNLNDNNYVDYQIFNTSVYLSVLQSDLYATKSFSISALLNGKSYDITTYNRQYIFSSAGLYTVTLKAKYNSIDIETILHFIIINPNIAYSSFSYVGLNGYTISKIERDYEDVTNDLKVFFKYGLEFEKTADANKYTNGAQTINANNIYLSSLTLSSKLSFKRILEVNQPENGEDEEETENVVYDYISGGGKYNITVLIDNGSVLDSTTFTFSVWIREEKTNLVIKPSIKEGSTTTKTINITFNPYLIYTQIGECSIVANETVLYTINANSTNGKISVNLPETNTTYTVQLKSEDNVELSFAVTKKEPLSTVSIIVITLSSIILGVAIFIFLRLRIKMRVK